MVYSAFGVHQNPAYVKKKQKKKIIELRKIPKLKIKPTVTQALAQTVTST